MDIPGGVTCPPSSSFALLEPLFFAPFRASYASASEANKEEEEEEPISNPKVLELAEQITQLNLLEVSELTDILRKRLNIQAPMGGMPFPMAGAAPAAPAAAADASAAPAQEEKTEFTVKLDGFDASSKIKVIKEVRAITELGLKEAKELVEGAPAVLKKSVNKEEAEQLKSKLEAAGAKISLD